MATRGLTGQVRLGFGTVLFLVCLEIFSVFSPEYKLVLAFDGFPVCALAGTNTRASTCVCACACASGGSLQLAGS